MKYLKNLLGLILFISLFPSCEENITVINEKPLTQYEKTRQIVSKKFQEASLNNIKIAPVSNDPCEIVLGPGCSQWIHPLELHVDLSDCSTSVTDDCLVYGEMKITVCVELNPQSGSDIEVNFEEHIWGHAADCIIDIDEHTDDFDCIMEVTYLAFVDYMMPIILELWGQNNNCDSGYDTYLSRYKKELCVYPCTEKIGPFYISRLVQCGESTACCVKEDLWCIDSNGAVQVTPGNKTQIGACSIGLLPCKSIKEDPWASSWTECRPRDCR